MSSTLIVGCGFVGRRAGRRLADRGERVFGNSRSTSRRADYAADGIELVVADVLNPETLADLPEVDRLFYAVGYDRSMGVPMRTVYVDGLKQVLDRMAGRVGRVVYASSTSVYGGESGDWVTEDSPTEPRTEAGAICLEAEESLRSWGDRAGTEAVVLRFSGLYGPGRIIGKNWLREGTPIPSDPDGLLNLIHGNDAARVVEAVLFHPEPSRLYNVTDDRPIQRREYYELAARCLKTSGPTFAEASKDKGSRRVANTRMKGELLSGLVYPDITSGLPAAVLAEGQPS